MEAFKSIWKTRSYHRRQASSGAGCSLQFVKELIQVRRDNSIRIRFLCPGISNRGGSDFLIQTNARVNP